MQRFRSVLKYTIEKYDGADELDIPGSLCFNLLN